MAEGIFDNWRSRENRQHTLIASHPQSVFSRWAGDEDTNEAERLCMDPTVRTGWWWWKSKVARGGFQEPDRAFRDRSAYRSVSRQRPCDLSGKWVDRVQERNPIGELILDLDRLVSETCGAQEGRPTTDTLAAPATFCFNQFGDLD